MYDVSITNGDGMLLVTLDECVLQKHWNSHISLPDRAFDLVYQPSSFPSLPPLSESANTQDYKFLDTLVDHFTSNQEKQQAAFPCNTTSRDYRHYCNVTQAVASARRDAMNHFMVCGLLYCFR